METAAKTGWVMKGRAPGMKWPLLGSAAGHLVLLSTLLLLGAAAGPGSVGVVQVVLVEGAPFTRSDADGPLGTPGDGPRVSAVRTATTEMPPYSASHAAPADTPTAPVGAPPTSSDAGPAGGAAIPPAGKAPWTPSAAASLSGAPVLVASARSGTGPVARASRGGTAFPDIGEGGGEKDGAPPVAGSGGKDGPVNSLLREKIQSRIVYPEEAIRRGQEGEVLLRIRIGDGGVPKEIRVARSSGTRALDEAARRGVVSASPLPSYPGWVEIPVRFFLR